MSFLPCLSLSVSVSFDGRSNFGNSTAHNIWTYTYIICSSLCTWNLTNKLAWDRQKAPVPSKTVCVVFVVVVDVDAVVLINLHCAIYQSIIQNFTVHRPLSHVAFQPFKEIHISTVTRDKCANRHGHRGTDRRDRVSSSSPLTLENRKLVAVRQF